MTDQWPIWPRELLLVVIVLVPSVIVTLAAPTLPRGPVTVPDRLPPPVRRLTSSGSADASLLESWGSISRVVPQEELRDAAFEIAAKICTKSRFVIRRAKECLNAIDPVDVKRSYRFEQGFTYELNLSGVSDEARDAFVDKRDAKYSK